MKPRASTASDTTGKPVASNAVTRQPQQRHNQKQDKRPPGYVKLLHHIRQEILQGKERIERFVNTQNVVTNRNVGRHIAIHFLHNNTKAAYGERIYEMLAWDLEVSKRFLQLTVQFYRMYPTLPQHKQIYWSHYRTLMTIPSASLRERLEKRIVKENLTTDRFDALVREIKTLQIARALPRGTAKILPYQYGRLHTYRIIKVNSAHGVQGTLKVDCGFNIRIKRTMDARCKLTSGEIVKAVKTEDGSYRLKTGALTKDVIYTYVASVERVVDGDTLITEIDCGFRIDTRKRLRLRGIDCPKRRTIDGQRAKKFVEDILKECDFIVIRTTRGTGKYGRYIADIFYLPGEKDPAKVARRGRFLNQALLDHGLAVRV